MCKSEDMQQEAIEVGTQYTTKAEGRDRPLTICSAQEAMEKFSVEKVQQNI